MFMRVPFLKISENGSKRLLPAIGREIVYCSDDSGDSVFLSSVIRTLSLRFAFYIGARAVAAASVEIAALSEVVSTPDEHFRVGPDRRVNPSGARGTAQAGACPGI